MESLLLSIIIPAYNAERYILRCLRSILLSINDLRGGVEIIVIDDGSTDHTQEMVKNSNHPVLPNLYTLEKNREAYPARVILA